MTLLSSALCRRARCSYCSPLFVWRRIRGISSLSRPRDWIDRSRKAFEAAAKLMPEWGLPQFQIAQQLVNSGSPAKAVPYLEKAVSYSPRSVVNRWNLAHVLRLAGDAGRAERESAELIRLDPDYPPGYLELAQAREAQGNLTAAAEAYDSYVLLAPNYASTSTVRARAAQLRLRSRSAPTLRK